MKKSPQKNRYKISTKLAQGLLLLAVFWGAMAHAQSGYSQNGYGNSIAAVPEPGIWLAQNDSDRGWRSKSDVMREAKRRYDARVLKITLNEKRGVYRVRLLMPNGKVRVVSINAKR